MLDDPFRVELRPWHFRAGGGVLLVERDQHPDELASHRGRSQYLRQLGEVEQPLCIPRRPVRIVAVDDAVHEVMRLAGLVEEAGNPAMRDGLRSSGALVTFVMPKSW